MKMKKPPIIASRLNYIYYITYINIVKFNPIEPYNFNCTNEFYVYGLNNFIFSIANMIFCY